MENPFYVGMEQKIMSFRLSWSGRQAIALNNQRCRFRRARAPVAKRVLVPVAALSVWCCFKPQVSDNFKVDAPESSSTARSTNSIKNKFRAVFRKLAGLAERLLRKRLPREGRKIVEYQFEDRKDAVTIVDLLNRLPVDRRSEKQVTKEHLLNTLSELKSSKGLSSTQVQAISLAMNQMKNIWEPETVPDCVIDSMALKLKICPSLLYAPGKGEKHYMIDRLCTLQSEGELTTDQMQAIPSVIQMLEDYCGDGSLPDSFTKSIATKLKIDHECLRPLRLIKKNYLLDVLRNMESGKRLANIQKQNIQGAIAWLEENYRSNRVHNDVVEVIASRVENLRGIISDQPAKTPIHETQTAG